MLDKFKKIGSGFSHQLANRASIVTNKATQITASRTPKKTPSDHHIVALDIGTEFVKALIGQVAEDGVSVDIVGVGRTHQELSDMQAGAIADISRVVANCDEALNEAEQQAGISARQAIIGIAGELVKGTTTTVRVARKDSSKTIDFEEMERMIHLVQERAETKAREMLTVELGGKDVEVRLVNSALVNIEIDGYPVTNPIGFQGKEVVVELYTAFAPMIHIGALRKPLKNLTSIYWRWRLNRLPWRDRSSVTIQMPALVPY